MFLATLCFAYAGALGWLVDPWLARGDRSRHTPQAWLWVRHATAAGTVLALAAGGLLLAHDVWEHAVSWALHAEKALVHAVYEAPRESPNYRNAAVLLLVILVAALAVVSAKAGLARRRRMRDHRLIIAGARGLLPVPIPGGCGRDETSGATVVPYAEPEVYCVPGRGGREEIVVTSGAVQRLSRQQLDAALAHEEAHLHRRHHAMVLAAEVCSRALTWTGALRHHAAAVRMLVEQAADDEAARRHGRLVVASALLAMSSSSPVPPPATGLPLTGTGDPSTRIRRLLSPRPAKTTRGGPLLLAGLSALLAGLPLLATVAPAVPLVGSVHGVAGSALTPAEASTEGKFLHHP